jgi:predicted methyltransferase MtxX (methanogen marker protein 4)
VDFADVIVVGKDIQKSTDLFVIDSRNIEKDLIELLKNKDADAVVRGSCDASKVLEEIHNQFNPQKIGRVALLAAASGQEFFFAPVGIDEGMLESMKATQFMIRFFWYVKVLNLFRGWDLRLK